MKQRFSLLWLLLAWTCTAFAADLASGFGSPRYTLAVGAEYAYNATNGHQGNADLFALLPINNHFELTAALQAANAQAYTAALVARPKFPLPVGEIFLDGGLLYKALVADRQHDFCTALSLGYRFDYLSFQFGMFSRIMTPFGRDWHSDEAFNAEPFNFLYRIEVFCRPQSCNWNISAVFTDFDDFQYERMWQPLFLLNGRYDPDEHWRVMLMAECKPTGMFHLNAAFYGVTARAAVAYRF